MWIILQIQDGTGTGLKHNNSGGAVETVGQGQGDGQLEEGGAQLGSLTASVRGAG